VTLLHIISDKLPKWITTRPPTQLLLNIFIYWCRVSLINGVYFPLFQNDVLGCFPFALLQLTTTRRRHCRASMSVARTSATVMSTGFLSLGCLVPPLQVCQVWGVVNNELNIAEEMAHRTKQCFLSILVSKG